MFNLRSLNFSLFFTFVLLFSFLAQIHGQELLSSKQAVFVVVDRDDALIKETDLDKVETIIAERLANQTGFTLYTFSEKAAGMRQEWKTAVRKGKYASLVDILAKAHPGVAFSGIFHVSLVHDPQYAGQGYISYFYYDLGRKNRDYRFIERAISMREITVMDCLAEVLNQPLGSMETHVDIYKPVSICFLIDNSGSMIQNDNDNNPKDLLFNPLETARANAIRMILNKLVVNDEFAFIFFSARIDAFNDNFIRIKDRKQVESLTSHIVDKIAMEPGTDISEAFRKARETIPQSQLSNVYIILLTDGNPTQGIVNLTELRRYAKDNFKKIPIFVIGLEGDQTKKGYTLEKSFLKNLAYDSSGTFNIIKIKGMAENRYAEVAMAVDNIFNVIRKEQTILNDERPTSRKVVGNRTVYSWDFNINSECSEFTVLIDPFEPNYTIEVFNSKNELLPPANIELIRLSHSASCKVSYPDCKGAWKLNVKVPQ